MAETIETPLTKLLGIKHPIMLAGMNKASGADLAAAVTKAGGLGVIGGVASPRIMRMTLRHLKEQIPDGAPFGVDLLLPQVGGNARKTNYDYTKGKLSGLIDEIIAAGPKLFVSAVGVPPDWVIKKLHDANILVMNMIGHPKHVKKACNAGVDIICAQGGEGGGHTGNIPTSVLLPAAVDLAKQYTSPLTGKPVAVVGAGGIYDGRGLVMALGFGCQAVWVGTRFVASVEAGASLDHKEALVRATVDDTYRTLVYTGRPMRIIKNDYVSDWHNNRENEMKQLLKSGTLPYVSDVKSGKVVDNGVTGGSHLCGVAAGNIDDVLPAKDIVENMVNEAVTVLREKRSFIRSRL